MTQRNVLMTMLAVGLSMAATFNSAMAQSGPELPFERLQAIAIEPATKNPDTGSRVVPEMLPLFQEEEIHHTGRDRYKDTVLKFRLHVPDNMEPGKTYPLILWLHGVGEAGDNNCDQLIHLHHLITYLTGPKKRDFFLLVPQTPADHTSWDAHSYYRTVTQPVEESRGIVATVNNLLGAGKTRVTEIVEEGEDFGDSPLGFSFAMLEQVCQQYPVDRDRITVSGLSSGGDGTWRALERGPDIFAAAVPLVSWSALKDEAIEKSPILKKIPIWAIYSSDDNGIDYAREDFARVEAAGCNVKKSEFGLCGHNAWTPAMLQADIFSWLLSRAKKDGEYITVEDASISPDDMQGIIDVAERDSRLPTLAPPQAVKDVVTIAADLPLVPSPPAAVVTQPLPAPSSVSVLHPRASVPVQAVAQQPVNPKIDELRYALTVRYYYTVDDMEGAARNFERLNLEAKIRFLEEVLSTGPLDEGRLAFLEGLLNQMSSSQVVIYDQGGINSLSTFDISAPVVSEPIKPIEVSPAVRRVVEECEKEWEMSTQTLYGLFAADWDKESEHVPAFVRNSTANELVQHIVEAVQSDEEKFQQLCDSILKLDNQPMSSPWFETSGGRLQSEITYSLSSRGKVLQALFNQFSNADLDESKRDAINNVLEKMDMILGK